MSWLLPSAFVIGGIAAVAAIALHFIARSRPLAEPLPTARFVPPRSIRARTRSYALNDVLLLLLRITAILAITAAVAAPVVASARGRTARIVRSDRSRAIGRIEEPRDSARSIARAGDFIVAFDSSTSAVASVDSLSSSSASGSLSTALVDAERIAATLADRADSVELVVISPFGAEEVDSATFRIRAAWPGRVRTVRVAASAPSAKPLAITTTATVDDPVIAGLSLVAHVDPSASIRVVRTRLTPADSAWARDSGHVLVHWPATDRDASWPQRSRLDAVGAVASKSGAVVARLPRVWQLSGRAIARWSDGEAAAVEHKVGAGCIRDVGILFDPGGDVTLRPAFKELVLAFLESCDDPGTVQPMGAAELASFAGGGLLATASALRDRQRDSSKWTPWLLGIGALLLIAELAMRRGQAGSR